MPKHSRSQLRPDCYRDATHQPLNCLIFVLPMLLFFHAGTVYYGPGNLLATRDLHRLLGFFGGTAAYLPAAAVMIVLFVQHLGHGRHWRFDGKVLAGMVGESILWMVPLIGLSYLTGRLVAMAAGEGAHELIRGLLVAAGAGIYEEFIFRLVFVSLVMLLLVDVFALKKDPVAVSAVLLSAVLFSLYHFTGGVLVQGEPFPWGLFVFRAVAGVYLGGLYVFRGFGIAVGAHALFDVYCHVATT